MNRLIVALCGAACVLSAAAGAQTAPAPTLVVGPADTMMRVGTKVPLRLSEELTTKGKKLRSGQRFQLETSEAVMVNNQAVLPAGTPATGEITEVRNKGMWGKSGHLGAQLLYLTVGGRQIRLTGTFDEKGTAGGVGAAAVSAIVFLPAGFFMTGTSAKLPVGTPVTAFIGEDAPLAFAAVTPVPLVVPAAAQPVIVPASATKAAR